MNFLIVRINYTLQKHKIKETGFHGVRRADAPAITFPQPVFNIGIRQLFREINILDGNFLKYIPDQFLSKALKLAKKEALSDQEKYDLRKMKAQNLNHTLNQGSGKDVGEVQKTFGGSPSGVPKQPKITQRKSLSENKVKKPQNIRGL